jgi:hypothetical protein
MVSDPSVANQHAPMRPAPRHVLDTSRSGSTVHAPPAERRAAAQAKPSLMRKEPVVQIDDLGAIDTVRAALALAIERAEAEGNLKELQRVLEARLFEIRQLLTRRP